MRKQKRIWSIIILIGISVFFAVIYYTQLLHMSIRLHSDDAGMATSFYDTYYMGEKLQDVFFIYSPMTLLRYLLFILFDYTESFVQIKFAVEYFFCLFPALILGIEYNKKCHWNLLPIFLSFMAIHGEGMEIATKFHVAPTVALLFILITVRHYAQENRKMSVYGVGLVILLSWIAISEKDLLCIIALICPLIIYKGVFIIRSKKYEKYYASLILFLLCVFLLAYFGISESSYKGWGAKCFAYPKDIIQNIDLGIQGILQMFNIPLLGQNIIQISTVIYFAKLLLLVCSIALVVRNVVQFLRNKQGIDKVNVLISLSVVCSIFAYLFSDRQVDLVSVRYMQSLDFLLPILLCRTLAATQFINNRRWYFAKDINVVTLVYLLFLAMAVWPISFEKQEIEEVDKLVSVIEKNEEIANGIADYWRGSVFGVLTQGENMVEAVNFENSEEMIEAFWGDGTEHEHYKSGYEYYNICIGNTTISKEKIQELYGNPIKTYEEGNTRMYVYDYDVRTIPRIISLEENQQLLNTVKCSIKENNILLKAGEEVKISLPEMFIGKFRYVIKVKNGSENINIGIMSNENIMSNIIERENDEIICEVYAHENVTNAELKLFNNGTSDIIFEEVCIQNLLAAEEIKYDENKIIDIPSGKFEITFIGEDIKKEVVNFNNINDSNIIIEEIKRGKERIVFEIQNNEKYPIQIKIDANEKMSCYIETPYVDRIKRINCE